MNKRFLAILIAFVLVLGTMPMPLAYASDIEGHREQTVIEMMSALSLVQGDGDGNFRPDDVLTRAEYTTLILRLLKLEDLVGNYSGNIPFTDVPESHWAYSYICAAYELGIINGMSETTFGVEEKVKKIDAIKILLCALGYRLPSEKLGGYPGGYMAMGTRLKLYKNLGTDTYITRAEACRLLYNSFSVEIRQEDENILANNKYVLDAYLDLRKVTGVIEETWHYQSSSISKGYIKVSGELYYAPLADADKYFGETVECYVKDDGSRKIVIFIKPTVTAQTLVVNGRDILPDTSLTSLKYLGSDKKVKKAGLAANLTVYKNGTKIPSGSLSASDLIIGTGQVVLKATKGGTYDLALVTEHQNFVVTYVSDNKIYDKFGANITVEEDDETIEFYKDNSLYTKELIKNGDILSVATSVDGRRMVYVSDESFMGSVTSIETTESGTPRYTIKDSDGNTHELELAKNYLDALQGGNREAISLRIGENYIYHFYLDIFGDIADITAVTVSENGEYGFMIRSGRKGSDLDGGAAFVILTMNNRYETFEIPSNKKIKFGRKTAGTYKISNENALDVIAEVSGKQLVKYVLDENGFIEEFYLADSSPSNEHFSNSGIEEKTYTYYNGLINQQLAIDINTSIFAININAQYEDIMYAGNYTTTLKDGISSFMRFYDREGNYVNAVVLSAKSLKRYTSQLDGYAYPVNYVNSPVFYIDEITRKTIDDETYTFIEGFQDGKAKSIAVSDTLEWYSEPFENLKEGIAIQYTSNSEIISRAMYADEIEQVIVFKTVFDFTHPVTEGASWEYTDLKNSRARIATFWGETLVGNESYCTLNINGEPFTASIHDHTMQLEYLKDENGFRLLTQPEINAGQKVFVRQRYSNTREVVIYER